MRAASRQGNSVLHNRELWLAPATPEFGRALASDCRLLTRGNYYFESSLG
jgi:hypothetical protein